MVKWLRNYKKKPVFKLQEFYEKALETGPQPMKTVTIIAIMVELLQNSDKDLPLVLAKKKVTNYIYNYWLSVVKILG